MNVAATNFWWPTLKKYMREEKGVEDWREAFQTDKFAIYLSDFLHHKTGAKDKRFFRFAEELKCNEPAPRITVRVC